jgi:integrase
MRQWRAQNDGAPGDALVFGNPQTGKPFGDIQGTWASIRKAAGLDELRLHDLRHHFVSTLVARGVDIGTAKELAGHSSLLVTGRYTHSTDTQKAAAVRVFDETPGENIIPFAKPAAAQGDA